MQAKCWKSFSDGCPRSWKDWKETTHVRRPDEGHNISCLFQSEFHDTRIMLINLFLMLYLPFLAFFGSFNTIRITSLAVILITASW